MSWEPHIYGSTDRHLPSPSSTPQSVTFPDGTLKTPKTDSFPQSHFLDAWATPGLHGQQTPVQTPSFTLSTPSDRPLSSYSQKIRTPEDPEFHVNHFAPHTLPLPPVEASRRLSSSPDPGSVKRPGTGAVRQGASAVSGKMDFSHMQTPPPTRDATSRRGVQQSGENNFATPATVIHRTPLQVSSNDATFNQTPFGYPNVHFSPDMMPFAAAGPMPAPPMPHSRLFWDQPADITPMDMDLSMGLDPFENPSQESEPDMSWQNFQSPATAQLDSQSFQALHSVSTSGPNSSFASTIVPDGPNSRPGSFAATSMSVDPSMLFSFSSPGLNTSFDAIPQPTARLVSSRQPYETQTRDAMREKEMAKQARSHHSRSNTNSSSGSVENSRPHLQRSNTDSGFHRSRPSSLESRSSGPSVGSTIPRRPSPLKKRQSQSSLNSIPEIRRARTRLVIDETGRARTETEPADDEVDTPRNTVQGSRRDMRHQYPGLWEEGDTESDDDEPPRPIISRHTSFHTVQPQRRSSSKHARTESGGPERASSHKMPRPMPRPSLAVLDKPSFGSARSPRRPADSHRRFSMMDFSTSFGEDRFDPTHDPAQSPGDALGALKRAVAGRQQRIERASQNTLAAHNQRWAQAHANASATSLHTPHHDPCSPSASTLTTPSTDRSTYSLPLSLSTKSSVNTCCVCSAPPSASDDTQMLQCESCARWMHSHCVRGRRAVCGICAGVGVGGGHGRVRVRRGAGGTAGGGRESPLEGRTGWRRI